MNRKGFTLIEVLAVVIIISLLIIIVFPSITNSLRNNRKKTDELMFSMIESATDLFVSDNSTFIKKVNGRDYCVLISNLVENDYLKPKIEYNGEDITDLKGVKITYDKGFSYELIDVDECIQLQNNYGYSLTFDPNKGSLPNPGYNLYNINSDNKGSYDVEENMVNVKLDSTYYSDMTIDVPTREGYTFLGWYTKNGVQVYDDSGYAVGEGKYFEQRDSKLYWIYEGDLTVYAKWQSESETSEIYDIRIYVNDLFVTEDYIDVESSDDVRFVAFNSNGDEVTEEVWVAYNSNYDVATNDSSISLSESGENLVEFGDEGFNNIYGSITINYKYYDVSVYINEEYLDFYFVEIYTNDSIEFIVLDSSGDDITQVVYLEVIYDNEVVYFGDISEFNIASAFGNKENGPITFNLGNGTDNDFFTTLEGYYYVDETGPSSFGDYVCNNDDCSLVKNDTAYCEYGYDGDYDTIYYSVVSDGDEIIYIVNGSMDPATTSEDDICLNHGRADEWLVAYNEGYNDGYYEEPDNSASYDGIFLDAYNKGYDEGERMRFEQDSDSVEIYNQGYADGCSDGELGNEKNCDSSEKGQNYCQGYNEGYEVGFSYGC